MPTVRQTDRAAQAEFVICEQSIDTNHGFAQTLVENSELAKRQSALEGRLANLQRWAERARVRWERAASRANRLWKETKARGDTLYREITRYICEHDRGDEREWQLQHKPVVRLTVLYTPGLLTFHPIVPLA